MRTALYARVSTERQERYQTIDSQLAALRAWAAAGGYDLADEHVFRDEGYSGGRLDRPGLDALRDAVRDGAVGIVAVLTPDRLARKYAYQVLLLEEFRRAGCEVAFLQHPISDDPNDQLLLQIQGAIAEYERAVLGERFRRGKLQKARDGHYQGGRAPYGYRYVPRHDAVPGHLVVDEQEAELVHTLYGWLADEGMTLRQILKRLNFGPYFPRSGRRPWSPSLVHHVLADPVYTGTAYANRYSFVPPKRPRRNRGPRTGEATCRQPKPREQWIAIPVPAIIDAQTWDRAQAQLARNAALSFRNNSRHSYLLRCLLTCETCGLAMFGRTYGVTAGKPERRYYRCAGKDCIETARPAACPSRSIKAEEIEAAVWDHVAGLLAGPERLLAQFDHLAATAEVGTARDQAAAQQLRARTDRITRADKRLLDAAYQAGAVSLAELSERRQHLAEERRGLERQPEERDRLRQQRVQAQAVRTSLEAFCGRIRGRLDEATFADKQAILQLVIERIIVGDGRLEIRHVIPLRPPQPGSDGPVKPAPQLRTDRVDGAALVPCRAHDAPDRRLQPLVGVRDHQLDAAQAAPDQALEEGGPECLCLARADVQAHDLPLALGVHGHGDYGRDRDDAAALALLEVGRIQPEIRPLAHQGAVEEGVHPLVDVLAQLAHRALADPREPHRLHQLVHAPGRDAADPGLLDHGDQSALGGLPRFQEGREVGRPGPELGDAQLQRAQPGVERAVAIAVAVRLPAQRALVAARADHALHVRLHEQLQHGLSHGAQEVAITGFGKQLRQWQSLVGHRVSFGSG
jgi:site-specific DNA recombinase